MKIKFLLAVLLLATALRLPAATNDLTSRLQQGLYDEEAGRDLNAAIADYQALAAQFDQDRQVAATAIYRLGECYRKLGQTNDAVTQYQRLIREFADQKDLVSLSQQNLTGLSQKDGPVVEIIPSPAAIAPNPEVTRQLDLVKKLQSMPFDALLQSAPTLLPDATLINLINQYNQCDLDLLRLRADQPVKEAEAAKAEAIQGGIGHKIRLRLQGLADVFALQLAEASNSAPVSSQFAQRLQAIVNRAPSDATTDEESQEIVRIQQMIQDSPDLINAPNGFGESRLTPLSQAAANGWLKVAAYLLDHGADVNIGAASGATALYQAARAGNRAMVEFLLSRGAEVNLESPQVPKVAPTPLAVAVNRGFPAVVEVLLAANADVNVPNGDGNTVLHEAVENNQDKITQMLLAKGANPNAKNHQGFTPLMAVPKQATLNTLQQLLAAGADPNLTNNQGRTTLSYAAQVGTVPELQLLLDAKADPNSGIMDAPLLSAINNGNPAAVECLLKAGANPNVIGAVDGELQRPFGSGKSFGNYDRVSTPLFFSVVTDQLPLVQLLLKYHADPNDERTDGRSLLFSALDKPDILAALLDAGAKVDARDTTRDSNNQPQREHWTPLLLALENNRPPEVVEMLLQHGANPNLTDDEFGLTPLLWSVGWGDRWVPNRTVVQLLLAHHADPNFRDSTGRTLLDHLKSMSKNATPADQTALASLCDLLRQHGALDHLPDWNHISASRPDAGFFRAYFTRETNDWNQFTLLELLAVQCRFLAASPASTGGEDEKSLFFNAHNQLLPFPDLTRLQIHRPTADRKSNQEITVNLGSGLQTGDCSHDVPLAWGDVVEIPETDHALKEDWAGFSDLELRNLMKCLTRQVSIIVKGQTNILTLAPDISFKGEAHGIPGMNQELRITTSIRSQVPYWLGPVLLKSGLVLTSSDLSRVQVTRRDPATGKTRDCTVDCRGISQNQFSDSDLWLRDGDVIEIPEKP